jgi:hypothetical protein
MDGEKTVQGKTLGIFGWHLSTSGMWHVTHIPTGHAVAACLEETTAEQLINALIKLDEWDDVLWDFVDDKLIFTYIPPELTQKAQKIYKRFSVPMPNGKTI